MTYIGGIVNSGKTILSLHEASKMVGDNCKIWYYGEVNISAYRVYSERLGINFESIMFYQLENVFDILTTNAYWRKGDVIIIDTCYMTNTNLEILECACMLREAKMIAVKQHARNDASLDDESIGEIINKTVGTIDISYYDVNPNYKIASSIEFKFPKSPQVTS